MKATLLRSLSDFEAHTQIFYDAQNIIEISSLNSPFVFKYSHLKEEALDRIKWRNRFGRGCGPVV
jgi:hypothetical protein